MTYGDIFRALADPTRRHIFESLRDQPQTVTTLAAEQPVSRPAVSQHLQVLASAQLVEAHPQGNRRIYSIKREGLEQLREYLEDFWTDTLAAYSADITQRLNDKQE